MASTNVTPALLTADQACDYLGIRKSKLYQLMADGEIRGGKLGRRRMFRVADLEAYVASIFDDETSA
ncbi:DNA binding domain-containing protein, excisionase family [Roseivivax halotolerans]|uniref:DNA binding domain-containing protein, excisionase family n=1 Tax=Roseivivax halotolerans TaxID=93684 RepID=A0A1I5ZGW8_9RHOB|nr:helix-turn-helix domain-containing protein [Roseivivax halotolerans]SFQ55724.1 DNA binding domain-containing protein, excisionase family [Roseivivax halotolerans]